MLDRTMALKIATDDVEALIRAEESYGDSWKKRGGIDSFMMLARKFDRLEHQCEKYGYNILEAGRQDTREEGIIDDIRDLRRYLILVEHELVNMANDSPMICSAALVGEAMCNCPQCTGKAAHPVPLGYVNQ